MLSNRHRDTHTHTQTKYCNPRCACVLRVNHWVLHSLLIMILALKLFFSDSQPLRCQYNTFLRKITALRPSILNFRDWLVKFCQKSSEQTIKKMALLVVVYEEQYSKFYVAPIFRALLENCHRLDLDTCVRRQVNQKQSV